ncbi:oocyte zinc finger protein XlCOF7.1 isoform X3 [Bombina bombina]|uniref:oocyte zinc finger protein XlCOF7.1 isoform X3 n=1 Tax=Bombina bombina TaxID=8345 RepID=UPI00235A7415|nr:oocyte zinc finger protein XlCOF7.1 isoform X3 [Bombina bombina]
MKNIMTERILNHALEIIYLLTGEISVFQDLVNSLIINDTSKDRKRTTERIVTHALEIISLLTGEVPIKCDDVAVYFTIEEWAFIEGHKEFYKDLVLENEESHRTLCISSSNSSGLEREHLDTDSAVAAAQEEEEERDTDVQQLDIRAETCAGEDLKTKQTEDLCASSDLQDLKQEICERLTTNLPEGNLQTECVNEEEEEEIDEKDILQIQIDSDSFSGDDYADDVVNAELTKDLGLNGPIKCIKQEDCEDIGSGIDTDNVYSGENQMDIEMVVIDSDTCVEQTCLTPTIKSECEYTVTEDSDSQNATGAPIDLVFLLGSNSSAQTEVNNVNTLPLANGSSIEPGSVVATSST